MPVDLGALEFERREPRRLVYHMMGIVEVPVKRQDPSIGDQLPVEIRSWEGCQQEELHARQLHPADELDGGLDGPPVVAFEAKHEHAMGLDASLGKGFQSPSHVIHLKKMSKKLRSNKKQKKYKTACQKQAKKFDTQTFIKKIKQEIEK